MVPIGSIEQDHQANDRTDANLNITGVPSPHAIRVWQEVAAGIDRSQTGEFLEAFLGERAQRDWVGSLFYAYFFQNGS